MNELEMSPVTLILFAIIISVILVWITVPVIVRLSILKKLFDVPNARKMNKAVVPNLGGVALFFGITIATLLCIHNYSFPEFRYILAGMIIMFYIGIMDDILIISAYKKLLAQMVCALILILPGNIRITDLHGILGFSEISYLSSIILSFIIIISIINAFNLIDGIDGLASALGILASIVLGTLFYEAQEYRYAIVCFAIFGSLITFFFYNVFGRENKIFMGDTGSLIIGLLFAVLIIKYNEIALTMDSYAKNFSPVISMAIIIIPIFDMIRLFGYRVFKRKSPFSADINHIHHKILKLGITHLKTTVLLLTANLFLIGIAFFFRYADNNIMLFTLILSAGLFSFIPDVISEFRKAENSTAKKNQLRSMFWPFKLF
jgi:UDP-N-acetylmuramyl pentapeptide phosphotransferase/UDP-N-acetylglucosamine-1-phosphate transferase